MVSLPHQVKNSIMANLDFDNDNYISFDMNETAIFDKNYSFLDFENSQEIFDPIMKNNLVDPFLNSLSHESDILGIVDPTPESESTESSVSVGHHMLPTTHKQSSPWHESDSGMSDTTISISGSPEHSYNYQLSSVADASTMSTSSDEYLDNELAAYFNSNNNPVSTISPTSQSETEDLSFFAQTLEDPRDQLIDVTSDDDLIVADSMLKDVQSSNQRSSNSTFVRPSEVKILKVVRPSNVSAGVTSEDIAKAMDERSKKNAAQAKMNREKKKAYIQCLENEVGELKKNNENLKAENISMKTEMTEKDEEIEYLKSVLANSSALSGLLKNITDVKEVKLSATIMSRKRAASGDHSYNLVENTPQKRSRLIDENLKKAGVCLHVLDGSACLEFCAHCSKLARKSHGHS